jgi:positive regulator of sigma E activity
MFLLKPPVLVLIGSVIFAAVGYYLDWKFSRKHRQRNQ